VARAVCVPSRLPAFFLAVMMCRRHFQFPRRRRIRCPARWPRLRSCLRSPLALPAGDAPAPRPQSRAMDPPGPPSDHHPVAVVGRGPIGGRFRPRLRPLTNPRVFFPRGRGRPPCARGGARENPRSPRVGPPEVDIPAPTSACPERRPASTLLRRIIPRGVQLCRWILLFARPGHPSGVKLPTKSYLPPLYSLGVWSLSTERLP